MNNAYSTSNHPFPKYEFNDRVFKSPLGGYQSYSTQQLLNRPPNTAQRPVDLPRIGSITKVATSSLDSDMTHEDPTNIRIFDSEKGERFLATSKIGYGHKSKQSLLHARSRARIDQEIKNVTKQRIMESRE